MCGATGINPWQQGKPPVPDHGQRLLERWSEATRDSRDCLSSIPLHRILQDARLHPLPQRPV